MLIILLYYHIVIVVIVTIYIYIYTYIYIALKIFTVGENLWLEVRIESLHSAVIYVHSS